MKLTETAATPVVSLDGDRDALNLICEAFTLGVPTAAKFLAEGLMNRNWRVVTGQGMFAVKQIHDGPVTQVRRNLRAATALGSAGLPVCGPLLTADGDPVAEVAGHSYCVFPWVAGTHRLGTDLSLDEACHLGSTLGGIHRALAGLTSLLDAPPASLRSKVVTAEAALAEATRFGTLAASQLGGSSAFDDEVTVWLDQRKHLIEAHGGQGPGNDVPAGPVGWTHGDVQHRNILWSDGWISAVIDWDKLRVRTLGEEIIRTATLHFGGEQGWLDLRLTAAFVAGYRTIVPISGGELADAVHRLWWKRLTDFWQVEFHYDRGDHSCDHLFFSGERFLHWWTRHRDEVTAAFA